ncbi:MFS transporter, partial [Alcanivoracaceae bacterium MT1]
MNLNNYKEILALKDFRRLWIAQMLSGLGNSLYFVSLMWLIWENTNSTLHTGLFAILYDIPQLFLGLWIGVVISRFSLKKVMVFSDIIRALGVCIVIACYLMDIFSVYILYLAIMLEGLMLVIHRPASNAILPQIVPKEKLESANATSQLSNRIINVAGYGVAGVIITTVGALFSII